MLVVDEGRQVARIETLIGAIPDVAVSHVVADRFFEGSLRDAVRWPVVPRVNQWSFGIGGYRPVSSAGT